MHFSNFRVSYLFLLALAMGFISTSSAFEGWQKRFSEVCNSTHFDMDTCTFKANCIKDKSKKNDKDAARRDSVLDLNKCFAIVERISEYSTSPYDFDWRIPGSKEKVVVDNFCQHSRFCELSKQWDGDDHEAMQRLHCIGDDTYGFEQWPFLDDHIDSTDDGHLVCFDHQGS